MLPSQFICVKIYFQDAHTVILRWMHTKQPSKKKNIYIDVIQHHETWSILNTFLVLPIFSCNIEHFLRFFFSALSRRCIYSDTIVYATLAKYARRRNVASFFFYEKMQQNKVLRFTCLHRNAYLISLHRLLWPLFSFFKLIVVSEVLPIKTKKIVSWNAYMISHQRKIPTYEN